MTTKLVVLVPIRDAEPYLERYLAQFKPGQVDLIVILDDGSKDKVFIVNTVARCAVPVQVIMDPAHDLPELTRMVSQYRRLLTAALEAKATHCLGCDVDMLYQPELLANIRAEVERHPSDIVCAQLRDLWEGYDKIRVDGIYGKKTKRVAFPCVPFNRYWPDNALHAKWNPPCLEGARMAWVPYTVYHLGMMTPAQRRARYEKFKLLDPERRYQAIGYDYMVDDTGLTLDAVSGL